MNFCLYARLLCVLAVRSLLFFLCSSVQVVVLTRRTVVVLGASFCYFFWLLPLDFFSFFFLPSFLFTLSHWWLPAPILTLAPSLSSLFCCCFFFSSSFLIRYSVCSMQRLWPAGAHFNPGGRHVQRRLYTLDCWVRVVFLNMISSTPAHHTVWDLI